MKFLNLLLVLLLPGVIYAADTTNLTRSAGKMVNDSSLELNSALASSPVVESTLVKPRGIENKSEPALNQQYRTANHGSLVEFEIFDAWVELTGDIDHDGFETIDTFINYSQGASVAPSSIFVHLCGISRSNGTYNDPV
mgnify:CR=1 FL=1